MSSGFVALRNSSMYVLAFAIFANCVVCANGNAFLGHLQPRQATAVLSAPSEHALLAALERNLGSGHRHATEKRTKRIEQMLSPMFGAMVKNEYGNLGPAAAGYMLHRVFVQRHGWFIRALEPANGSYAAWSTSTPTSVLEERVPAHIVQLFEDRLGQHGLGLRELAILAATLEHMVHLEALQRLNVSYQGVGVSIEDTLSNDEAIEILDVYMSSYILGFMHDDLNALTGDMAKKMHQNILKLYPTWPETQQFLREVHSSVARNRDYFYYNDVETIVAEIGERYGRFQDQECRQLKDWLVEIEDSSIGGAGRVRISDFYGRALNDGKWQFSESIDYLRQLGALDESDLSNPRVIIPNYISGPANCVASSAYYSVCCLDECESILGQIEQKLEAPTALPSTIIDMVSMIASATMPSNRSLSPWLHQRLNEVADHHGGVVPLHGRLFAQWLHYAYPRECRFPHLSGTINPQRQEDILGAINGTDQGITATEDEMKRLMKEEPEVDLDAAHDMLAEQQAGPRNHRVPGLEVDASEESAMWSLEEELVVWRFAEERSTFFELLTCGRPIAFMGALFSLAIAMMKLLEPALKNAQKAASDQHYV